VVGKPVLSSGRAPELAVMLLNALRVSIGNAIEKKSVGQTKEREKVDYAHIK
jgi:hypothetical protein